MRTNSDINITKLSDIHKNWFDGLEACSGCPRRDCDGVTTPLYAYGDVPADVAIVAQAPGGESIKDVTGSKIGDGKRNWKNYSDSNHGGATASSREGFKKGDLDTVGNYTKDIAPIVDAFNQTYQNQFGRICRAYYTQHTKCNDIHADGVDPKNDNGQDNCASYLIPELNLVNPDIILIMGGKPSGHLQRALNDIGVQADLPSKVTDTVFADGKEATKVRTYNSYFLNGIILPSFHYGFKGMGAMKQYTSIDSDQKYWKSLAEGAVSQLN